MADGGGRGHFKTMAEIRTAVADHERRLLQLEDRRLPLLEQDVVQLTDELVTGKRVRQKKRKVR